MMASRAVRCVSLLLGLTAAGAAVAGTPALVVDVDSGKVLYADHATDPWFPASITKLMTTYVALDMVRQGKVSLDQLLTVSAEAAAQPPSKMGFKPGTQLTLDNALKIIMVKSANDIAMAIGENLGGSVEGFADLMNQEAERLGMHESHFANPNGLPDEHNYTSARDMAVLARALYRDFPEHKGLFSIGAIRFGRHVTANHNGLIGRYPGADGMKTGFICAAGFNVVASATRDGRHILAVVLGAPSARQRDLKTADLLDQGFATSGFWGQTLDQLPPSSMLSPPNMRSVICERRGPPPEEDALPVARSDDGRPVNPDAVLFASRTLAGSGHGGDAAPTRRTLGPRAHFDPVRVWVGATPPTAVADTGLPEEDAADAAPKPRKGKVRVKSLARGGKGGAIPATARAFAEPTTPAIIDDGKGAKAKSSVTPAARPHTKSHAKTATAAEPAKDRGATAEHKNAKHHAKARAKTTAKKDAKAKQ